MNAPPFLTALDERIEVRVRAIVDQHTWWPCRRGCDACCRSLGEMPHATRAEWDRLGQGLNLLDDRVQGEIAARVAALAVAPASEAMVCPFLDHAQGACLVYQHRLLACRAYGSCASRGEGRWCMAIQTALAAHDEPIVFGNWDAIMDQARADGGDTITLLEWWQGR